MGMRKEKNRFRGKGQFMILSSIIISLIVISVAGAVSEVQSRQYQNSETAYWTDSIREEASKVDISKPDEREGFRNLVQQLPYSTETVYWNAEKCFNVTVTGTSKRIRLNCIS